MPIAKSLHIDEITTSHFANAPRNDINGHLERSERTQSYEILRLKPQNDSVKKLDCHVADAPRYDMHRHPELVSGAQNDTVFSRKPNPSQPCLSKGRSKVAFTLAEVLITLGIIGVVAALTLPSVITKFQQKSFSTAFKKEYSVLNNAINMVVYEQDTRDCYQSIKYGDGTVAYDAVVTDCLPLKKGLISKLSLTPVKKDFVYTKRQDVKNNGGVSSNFNVIYDYWLRCTSAFMLQDGAIVLFYYNEQNLRVGDYANVVFVVDINGKKGPNRWGYDVFWLSLVKNDNGIRLSDEYATLSEKGGSLPRNILLNKWSNDYNKNVNWGLWN